MKHSIYLNAKQVLINEAKETKRLSNDKPYIRQCINDQADQMRRQIDFYAMKDCGIQTQIKALYQMK